MFNQSPLTKSSSSLLLGIFACILLLVIRLATLPFPDLIDSTEGRYAAAALTMLERGDYLTPWIDMGEGPEPYLGKPPMHFWLTIVSYKLFGVSAFSARLPSFIATLVCAALLFWFTKQIWGPRSALLTILFYLSSGLTFFLAGAALLDTTLMLFITSALILFAGFYFCGLDTRPRITALLVGAALSGAFLTKGPVAIAIFIACVVPWGFLFWEQLKLKKFPFVFTLVSFIALTSPWYLACEWQHPGFLWYFIVKENLLRVVSENYGDRYGSGHPQFFGTSFLHVFLCFLPWSLVLLTLRWKRWKVAVKGVKLHMFLSITRKMDPILIFAGAWSLSMPVFLCLTSQYTANYLAPIMPGLALLLGGLVGRSASLREPINRNRLFKLGFVTGSATIVILPFVGIALQAPWWIISLSWLFLIALTALFRRYRAMTCEQLYYLISAFLAVFYLTILMSFTNHISSRRSTREILSVVRKLPGLTASRTLEIGFIGQLPFSSAVYGAIESPRIHVSEVSIADCCSSKFDFFITSSQKLHENEKIQAAVTVVGRTRKWVLVKPREALVPELKNSAT